MTTDTEGQQPKPAEGEQATNAEKPNGQPGATAAESGSGGEGGGAGEKAGDQGEPKKGEGEDGAGDGQKKDTEGAKSDEGPPEAYEDFNLPEGFVLDGERKESTLALFRDLGLSQDKAQAAIDHFIKTVGEDAATQQAALEAAVQQQRDDWAKQAKEELGEKYDSELKFALTAVKAMESETLTQAFNEHGWGNHPELIKAFAFFGKMMRDSPVDGIGSSGASPEKKKPWDAMYSDEVMK